MHLVVLNNCLKNLKFQYTFASLPIQPTVIFPYRDVTFKKSSDQKLPRGQKKRPDFKLFTDSAHPDRDTGEWHIDGGALSGYSEVLVGTSHCCGFFSVKRDAWQGICQTKSASKILKEELLLRRSQN